MTELLQGVWDRFIDVWPYLLTAMNLAIALAASGHVVLYKRDTRAVVAWVGLIWLVPMLGALLYVLFGVNRIRRRAQRLRARQSCTKLPQGVFEVQVSDLPHALGPSHAHLGPLARVVAGATGKPLLGGNRITPLHNGDEAYSAMIEAIDQSRDYVLFSAYIFDNDKAGLLFVEAFQRAIARQIEVRVLIDDFGARYSWPSIIGELKNVGVRVARFLPKRIPTRFQFANLRNHRKIMVVDGQVGFTGGMNIREGCLMNSPTRHRVQDLHFRIEGPAVAHLHETFADDWAFATGELLQGARWYPRTEQVGSTLARGIAGGPDENFERLRMTLLAAIASARSSVLVMTPYFLPDVTLISALNVAAMRGVKVNILLPAENNLRVVQWASTAQLWQVLERGCRVWLTPPPFDHTKLMIVDEAWVLLGSSNWDPRSLRLNFEFDLECYDGRLGESLSRWVQDNRLREARQVTLAEVDGRRLPIRLRDGLARLLSPYL